MKQTTADFRTNTGISVKKFKEFAKILGQSTLRQLKTKNELTKEQLDFLLLSLVEEVGGCVVLIRKDAVSDGFLYLILSEGQLGEDDTEEAMEERINEVKAKHQS